MQRLSPRIWIALIPAALATAAAAAPQLWRDHALVAFSITQFFSVVCHQQPARSFWIAGAPLAVCTRCLGLYVGATAGAWISTTRLHALQFIAIAAAVNAADVLAETAGLHGNWSVMRFVLGAGLGMAISALVVSALERRDNRSFSAVDC